MGFQPGNTTGGGGVSKTVVAEKHFLYGTCLCALLRGRGGGAGGGGVVPEVDQASSNPHIPLSIISHIVGEDRRRNIGACKDRGEGERG